MTTDSKNRLLAGVAALSILLSAVGCSVAPVYEKPDAPVSNAFKEWDAATLPPSQAGAWKVAEPAEQAARGEWWRVFADATLDGLENQALAANQDLKAAVARVAAARAFSQGARAGLFPTLEASLSPFREKPSAAAPDAGTDASTRTTWRGQFGASYELDLFGRVAAGVEAAQAEFQRSEALLRSVQLTLQADVAQTYFALRGQDSEVEVFASAVDLRGQALALVQQRFADSEISELDVARARAELAAACSELMTVQRLRAASEHALAVLLGKVPAEFSLAPAPLRPLVLRIPPGLPSALLERRPDIAAAERAMAATNARIGVAEAAFFPALTMTGAAGTESASLGDLFQWSSRTFLLGPLLSVPLFDGGARSGNLAKAKAEYEEDVALYRQRVLAAFREVEDGLAALRIIEGQAQTQAEAVSASARAAQLARAQYAEGAVDYLDVIEAERTLLQSRRAAVQLEATQATSTVGLIRALGGGWSL